MSKRNTQEYNSLYHNHLTKGGIMTTSIDSAKQEQVSIETLQENIKVFCENQERAIKKINARTKKDVSTLKACCVGFAGVTFASLMYMYGMGTPPSLSQMWVVGGFACASAYKLQQFVMNVTTTSDARSQALASLKTNTNQDSSKEIEMKELPAQDDTGSASMLKHSPRNNQDQLLQQTQMQLQPWMH